VIPLTLAAIAEITGASLGVAGVADGPSAVTNRSKWWMEVTERPDGVTVINDAYNANNSEAVAAALDTLATVARGRRAFVPDAGGAVAALGNLLAPGDVVLVKASCAVGLERVALALTGEAAQ
jgi:UDP-N-acetylmuramoyl-tripeptide--D-alanyl-D-alanine ligase